MKVDVDHRTPQRKLPIATFFQWRSQKTPLWVSSSGIFLKTLLQAYLQPRQGFLVAFFKHWPIATFSRAYSGVYKTLLQPSTKKNNGPIAVFANAIIGLGLTRTQACPWVGSDRVCAKPASDPTKSSGQTFNPSPTERMIGSGKLKHQRAAVVFGSESRSRKLRKSVEKTTKIDQNPLRFHKK